VGEVRIREARAKAKALLGLIGKGVDPRPKEVGQGEAPNVSTSRPEGSPDIDLTLRAAWTRYRDAHLKRKGRSEGTIENCRDHVERLMADWLDQPLWALGNSPSLVTARHEKITQENGPYIANGCMRSLRAIYNHARRTARSLPAENPVTAVDWNSEKRRNTALGLNEVAPWVGQLEALENPIRREFHWFLLLSGSRPDALKRAKIEHIDFRSRILHIPKPKGGEIRAFDIPLSRPMIRCLVRVLRLGQVLHPTQAREWLFPADSESGRLVEHKEDRAALAKWGNDLRQTYRTVAQTVGVADLDIHLLMNHSVISVNAGYINRNKLLRDHLRHQQEMISCKIVDTLQSRSKSIERRPPLWPLLTARRLLSELLCASRAGPQETEAGEAKDGVS
jgi:integrase